MPATFISLPSEIRNSIYEILLIKKSRIDVRRIHRMEAGKNGLTPGLLATNREVHHETAPVLYARNSFNFRLCSLDELSTFFQEIGEINANHIRMIFILFPRLRITMGQPVAISNIWSPNLKIIGRFCGRLSTVGLCFNSTGTRFDCRALPGLDGPHQTITQVIGLMDAHIKAMPSRPEIVVEAFEFDWKSDFLPQMQRHGWIAKIACRADSRSRVLIPFDEYVASRTTEEH